jgi:hypothetical protein
MYYARLVKWSGNRAVAEKLTKEFDKISRNLPGFRGNVYFFDESEYRALNYWETKDDAMHAHKVLFPKLENELKNVTSERPAYQFFEVFDPADDGELLSSHTKWV